MSHILVADSVSVVSGDLVLLPPTSFAIASGEALAVTGSNGSGKTTLLRVLAGLTPPTSGVVTVAGTAINERDGGFRSLAAALIGLPPFARNLTLHEHMMLVATSWGASIAIARGTADRLLMELGIAGLHERFPHELSSGQTQLFALALTLSRPFEVLLLDEPEQRLDSERLELISNVLGRLVKSGKTLILASHSNLLVERLTGRILMLEGATYDSRP